MTSDFLGLAHMVAREWERRQTVFAYDELVSICWLAGDRARHAHDGSRSALSTFLIPRMRWAVVDALRTVRGRHGKHAEMLELDDPHVTRAFGSSASESHEDAVVLSCELAQLRARLSVVDRLILDAVLHHGYGGTEQQLYAPVAHRITIKTFRIHRCVVVRKLKALLREEAA